VPSRFAIRLEYDGTAYAGSQLQKDRPTIQGALEAALLKITNQDIRVDLSGRTDAGVHAVGQVAAFTADRAETAASWQRALNGVLPEDISVLAAAEVRPNFDPRRDARSRWYRYTITTRAAPPALARHRAWHVSTPLDIDAMQVAADALAGRHDFAAFCGALEPGRTTTRTIFTSCLSRRRDTVRYDVVGDAFLPQQVRRMVAALVRVGQGKMLLDELTATLDQADLGASNHVAPPHGLCLMKVEYERLDLDFENEDL
jgi:tRNA pseudouridine38-40 synthase